MLQAIVQGIKEPILVLKQIDSPFLEKKIRSKIDQAIELLQKLQELANDHDSSFDMISNVPNSDSFISVEESEESRGEDLASAFEKLAILLPVESKREELKPAMRTVGKTFT